VIFEVVGRRRRIGIRGVGREVLLLERRGDTVA
jgi:hypothetical protein